MNPFWCLVHDIIVKCCLSPVENLFTSYQPCLIERASVCWRGDSGRVKDTLQMSGEMIEKGENDSKRDTRRQQYRLIIIGVSTVLFRLLSVIILFCEGFKLICIVCCLIRNNVWARAACWWAGIFTLHNVGCLLLYIQIWEYVSDNGCSFEYADQMFFFLPSKKSIHLTAAVPSWYSAETQDTTSSWKHSSMALTSLTTKLLICYQLVYVLPNDKVLVLLNTVNIFTDHPIVIESKVAKTLSPFESNISKFRTWCLQQTQKSHKKLHHFSF